MSIHLPPPENISVPNSDIEDSSSSSEGEDEETWDDWVSDSNTRQGCKSLFDDKILSCVEDVVAYDRESYKVDIIEICKRLCKFPLRLFHIIDLLF
jgi:type I protein arginine methyltransferase